MEILAHSKEQRGNELVTYQFECPTYLLPELLKFKKMEVSWNIVKETLDEASKRDYPFEHSLITITTSKPALEEFFDKVCPIYPLSYGNHRYRSKKEYWAHNAPNESTNRGNDAGFEFINQNKTTDIHLQQIAEQMYDLYQESEAVELKSGEWHLPFKSEIDYWKLGEATSKYYIVDNPSEVVDIPKWELKISTALSSNPPVTDYSKLIEIHDQLLKDNELDTFVHCARVMSNDEYVKFLRVVPSYDSQGFYEDRGICDNYKGFISYKNIIENDTNT